MRLTPELPINPIEIVFVLACGLSTWLCINPVNCLQFLRLMPRNLSQAAVRLVRGAAALVLIGLGVFVVLSAVRDSSVDFFVIYFLAGFCCIYLIGNLALAFFGGWLKLAKFYRATEPFEGKLWPFEDGYMRFLAGYKGLLTIGANTAGLYTTNSLLFHAPVFVPWEDISVRPGRCMWVSVFIFEFRQVPSVPLELREALGKRIQHIAGSSWPGERLFTEVQPTR